ncbi:MAG: protein phosphatase 2C domain-containing protein [Gemmataceae bacterium]|nr:protein phosphatase 2C domain-containing protein [Gemmataceae bacterium]
MVNETHLGTPVQCGRCSKPFSVRVPTASAAVAAPAAPPPPAASSDDDDDVHLEWDAPGVAEIMGPRSTPAASRAPGGSPAGSAAATMGPSCRLEVGAATHPGRVRARNEDSFLIQSLSWCNLDLRRDIGLFVVADGVGGSEAGDQASGLVIRVIGNTLAPLLTGVLTGQQSSVSPAQLVQAIDGAVHSANRVVFQRSQTSPTLRGMAATAAVVLFWDGLVYISHVGDCRVYHYRAGQIAQVTKDQTLVARMVELGQLSPREAANHPARNEVAQAVGKHAEIAPAPYQLRVAPGDWLIVACDGLHAHVEPAQMVTLLRQPPPAASFVAQQFVEMANAGGGSDNVTVVAVRCM